MNPRAGDGDEGLEAGFGLFVERGEFTKTLEFAEATFDPIALFVEIFVVLALRLAISFEWDHGFGCHGFNVLHNDESWSSDLRGNATEPCPRPFLRPVAACR